MSMSVNPIYWRDRMEYYQSFKRYYADYFRWRLDPGSFLNDILSRQKVSIEYHGPISIIVKVLQYKNIEYFNDLSYIGFSLNGILDTYLESMKYIILPIEQSNVITKRNKPVIGRSPNIHYNRMHFKTGR